ncbi:four-carbon acid sugar kinase family protein [Bacillus solitudinis]|uniref:four-carbon acid sugar kinase family protein n=1 Tax=Bacillus solitudinis TaxID=2014074 RepID=UPI000C23C5E1|nr:four-carbon acid sugar kinase family protein [Bacillus solitudinis]
MQPVKKRLLTFYGDDFTGSTDVMETLAKSGIKAMLFLKSPSRELLEEEFPDIEAVGVAGIGRSLTPEEMEEELPPIFSALAGIPSHIMHYKTCSTFDSSTKVGNIGKAIEIAQSFYQKQRYIPLLVAAPALKRYTVFGHHFASIGETTYRLDRHPVMSRHGVTPMDEADLSIHLSKQTNQTIGLVDIVTLSQNSAEIKKVIEQRITSQSKIILFDAHDENHIEKVGEALWDEVKEETIFVVGSSGIEHALTSIWKQKGLTNGLESHFERPDPVEQLIVVSGSCSMVTQQQIEYATSQGFIGIQMPVQDIMDPLLRNKAYDDVFKKAKEYMTAGKSIIFYTALGPDDNSIGQVKQSLVSEGQNESDTGKLLGEQLGRLCKELIRLFHLKRVAVAGGDTSGYVLKELQIFSLEMAAPLVTGAPLCKCHSEDEALDGLEITLKGGQMGREDFFVQVKNGQ